jgi:hypothetical protein
MPPSSLRTTSPSGRCHPLRRGPSRPPLAAGLVSPLAAGLVSPLAAGLVSPLAAGLVSPLAAGLVSPFAAGLVSPLAALVPVLVAGLAGCEANPPAASDRASVEIVVDGQPIDRRVVDAIVAREAVDREEARRRAAATARLANRAEQAHAARAQAEEPLLAAPLARLLRRNALAQLWLREVFEPRHRPDDVPLDSPEAARARASSDVQRPELHLYCQFIAIPDPAPKDPSVRADADPEFVARATAALEPVARMMQGALPPDDPDPCELLRTWGRLVESPEGLQIRLEPGAIDLDACAEPPGTSGGCVRPMFAEEFTAQLRGRTEPGWIAPFPSRFGVHLVFFAKVLPALAPEGSELDAAIREAAHAPWRRRALEERLETLRARRAVRVAAEAITQAEGD